MLAALFRHPKVLKGITKAEIEDNIFQHPQNCNI